MKASDNTENEVEVKQQRYFVLMPLVMLAINVNIKEQPTTCLKIETDAIITLSQSAYPTL